MYKVITLQPSDFDISDITSELELKIGGIEQLQSPLILNELADAVFTLSAKAFVKAMNLEAKAFPKKYHHIYEWNQVGTEKGRLFFLATLIAALPNKKGASNSTISILFFLI